MNINASKRVKVIDLWGRGWKLGELEGLSKLQGSSTPASPHRHLVP